jgi:hypothetical protein
MLLTLIFLASKVINDFYAIKQLTNMVLILNYLESWLC